MAKNPHPFAIEEAEVEPVSEHKQSEASKHSKEKRPSQK